MGGGAVSECPCYKHGVVECVAFTTRVLDFTRIPVVHDEANSDYISMASPQCIYMFLLLRSTSLDFPNPLLLFCVLFSAD